MCTRRQESALPRQAGGVQGLLLQPCPCCRGRAAPLTRAVHAPIKQAGGSLQHLILREFPLRMHRGTRACGNARGCPAVEGGGCGRSGGALILPAGGGGGGGGGGRRSAMRKKPCPPPRAGASRGTPLLAPSTHACPPPGRAGQRGSCLRTQRHGRVLAGCGRIWAHAIWGTGVTRSKRAGAPSTCAHLVTLPPPGRPG